MWDVGICGPCFHIFPVTRKARSVVTRWACSRSATRLDNCQMLPWDLFLESDCRWAWRRLGMPKSRPLSYDDHTMHRSATLWPGRISWRFVKVSGLQQMLVECTWHAPNFRTASDMICVMISNMFEQNDHVWRFCMRPATCQEETCVGKDSKGSCGDDEGCKMSWSMFHGD